MKRLTGLVLLVLFLIAGQVFAQDANIVTLDDSNPSISAAITMPADTTGVVTVNLSQAALTLTDANGRVVFSSADPRVHYLELSIAPNSGDHTLTVQRLPGESLASVQIGSQADLTKIDPIQNVVLVDTGSVGLAQQHTLTFDATHPADQVALDIQPNTTGLVTASFPGAFASTQLIDDSGLLVATSSRDVDGFNVILDGGRYDLNLQANPAANTTNAHIAANVSVTPTDQFALLGTPQLQAQTAQTAQTTTQTQSAAACTATVIGGSINLRSGPGTGYSVLDFGTQGEVMNVGGTNPEQNWIVVGTNGSSAWVQRNLTQLDGDCSQMAVFNIPLREAQAAPVVVQSVPSSAPAVAPSGQFEDDNHHEDDHHQSEGGEHHGSDDSGGDD